MSSGKKETVAVSLPITVINWLDSSAKSHSLPSRSKAIRCCINCVAIGDVEMPRHNSEDKHAAFASGHQAVDIELAAEQIKWMDRVCCSSSEGSSRSEVLFSVIKVCMDADEAVVFGVVRCKTKVAACDGAQYAVDSLAKKYGSDGIVVKEEIKLP